MVMMVGNDNNIDGKVGNGKCKVFDIRPDRTALLGKINPRVQCIAHFLNTRVAPFFHSQSDYDQ